MTRDEILNMPAGKELDALVAEKVMGWVEYYPHISTIHHFPGWFTREPDGLGCCEAGEDWSPSTNISAAWQVVLKFMDDGCCPNLVNDDNGHWALSFEGTQNFPTTIQTSFINEQKLWCDTAPLAICRATLLATMEFE